MALVIGEDLFQLPCFGDGQVRQIAVVVAEIIIQRSQQSFDASGGQVLGILHLVMQEFAVWDQVVQINVGGKDLGHILSQFVFDGIAVEDDIRRFGNNRFGMDQRGAGLAGNAYTAVMQTATVDGTNIDVIQLVLSMPVGFAILLPILSGTFRTVPQELTVLRLVSANVQHIIEGRVHVQE